MTERRMLGLLGGPVLLLAGLLAAGLALRALPVGGGGLGEWARRQGPGWFCAAATLACAVGIPRQAVAFAGGYAWGPWLGGSLALIAETLGCLCDVLWARAVAQRWVRRRFGHRLAGLDRMLARRPFGATLSLRLLPVGNNLLLNFAAGSLGVAVIPFLLGSCVGFVPQTIVFALLGSGTQVGAAVQLVLGAVLFLVSAGLGVLVLRAGTAR